MKELRLKTDVLLPMVHTFVKKGYLALVVKLLAVEIDQKQLNYVYWKRGVMLGISFKLKPPLVLQTLGLIV